MFVQKYRKLAVIVVGDELETHVLHYAMNFYLKYYTENPKLVGKLTGFDQTEVD